MADRVHHIIRGMMLATGEPVCVQSVVSAGFAVGVVLEGRRGGGLVHFGQASPGMQDGDYAPNSGFSAQLETFLSALSKVGPITRAQAAIAGGADVLSVLPKRIHEAQTMATTTRLGQLLEKRSLSLSLVAAGGNCTRAIKVDLKNGCIDIQPVRGHTDNAASPAKVTSREGDGREGSLERSPGSRTGAITVGMGAMCIERSPAMLITVLGSCVGVALFDPSSKIGGLAHVVLPCNPSPQSNKARFADTAVEGLIDAMEALGAHRANLVAKIAGGASIIFVDIDSKTNSLPGRNVDITRASLATAGIPILFEDVGGNSGEKDECRLIDV